MSNLATAALILFGIWLVLLTVVVILVVRQIGLLTVRLSMVTDSFSPANDGPDIGSTMPEEVVTAVPQLADGLQYVMLLSATCTPCRELATNLRGHRFNSPITVLIAGRDEVAQGMTEFLSSSMQIIHDPEANRIAQVLQIKSTPFAVAADNGTIMKKTYLHSADDFVAFVNGQGKLQKTDVHQMEGAR